MMSFRALRSYVVVSVWDLMKLIERDFLLRLLNFLALGDALEKWPPRVEFLSKLLEVDIPDDTSFMQSGSWTPDQLLKLAGDLERNGFEFSAIHVRNLGAATKPLRIPEDFPELYHRLMDELGNMLLMRIPADKAKFWGQSMPCGLEAVDAFPKANEELIRAGDCLAADCNTAAVFHLMRAMEIILRQLASALELPDPIKESDRNWSVMLRNISAKIQQNTEGANHQRQIEEIQVKLDAGVIQGTELDRTKAQLESHKTALRKLELPPSDWSKTKEFFTATYDDLYCVKVAWRDKTMHIEASYDTRRAMRIYEAVCDLVRHAAERLHE